MPRYMIPGREVSYRILYRYSVLLPIVKCKPPLLIFNLLKRVMSKRCKYDLELGDSFVASCVQCLWPSLYCYLVFFSFFFFFFFVFVFVYLFCFVFVFCFFGFFFFFFPWLNIAKECVTELSNDT